MKSNNNPFMRQSFLWIAAFAVAALALGLANYRQSEARFATFTQNQTLMDKLRDTAELNRLIMLINNGRTETAKKILTEQLAYNLAFIETLKSPADANSQGFAKVIQADILRDEKKHPEYYPTSAKSPVLETRVAQIFQH